MSNKQTMINKREIKTRVRIANVIVAVNQYEIYRRYPHGVN